MTKLQTYSTDQIKKMQTYLKNLPVKDTSKTKKEVIEILEDNIRDALEKGYTLKDICDVLNKNNIKITYATLKAYLQRVKIDDKADKNISAKAKKIVIPEQNNINSTPNSFIKKDIEIEEL